MTLGETIRGGGREGCSSQGSNRMDGRGRVLGVRGQRGAFRRRGSALSW